MATELQASRSSPEGAKAYVGLGSNLNDPETRLKQAFDALDRIPRTRCLERSRIYQSRPVGPPDQPDYLNAVALLSTQLDAHRLLAELQHIERVQGRVRDRRWGPRTLDLDLLLFADLVIETPDLVVPHAAMHQRLFVLLPLADISPELRIPGRGKLQDLIKACSDQGVRPLV